MNLEPASITHEPQECQQIATGRSFTGDERRQALVSAAYDLIATKGFEGLRVRDVAALGGVNIATLHYYFPSKETLIGGVVQHLLHQFLTLAPRVPEGEESTAAQRLERELSDMEYELQAAPQMWTVMMELQLRSLRDPAISAVMKDSRDGAPLPRRDGHRGPGPTLHPTENARHRNRRTAQSAPVGHKGSARHRPRRQCPGVQRPSR